MSLQRSGTTKDTVGRSDQSAGSAVKGWFTDDGRSAKLTHGLCLRAYRPAEQPVNPALGRPSEKPTKVCPAASSSDASVGPDSVSGQELSSTPCVEPEKS